MMTTEFAKGLLIGKQQELLGRLTRIERDRHRTEQKLSADSEDRATERENDEVLDRLAEATARHLVQVHHALDRIGSGEYGDCEQCGGPISPQRLSAVPEATLCSVCAPGPGVPARSAQAAA